MELTEARIREIVREELAVAKPTRGKRATIIPSSATLATLYTLEEWAQARKLFPNINLDWEAGKCVDYWNAKGGSGNWKLAFKNWLGKAEPTRTRPEEAKKVYRAPIDAEGKPILGGKA